LIPYSFDKTPDLTNLLLDDYFKTKVEGAQAAWRRVAAAAVTNGRESVTCEQSLD